MGLFADAYWTLKGKRQTSTWGLLYGIQSEVEADFEQEEQETLTEFICQRCGCTEAELLDILYRSMSSGLKLLDMPKKVTPRATGEYKEKINKNS